MREDDSAEIIALEQQRCKAELEGDSAALERLLDDSLVHVHGNGVIDGKQTLIAGRKNLKFLTLTRQNLKAHISGDLAVLTGSISFEVKPVGKAGTVSSDAFVTQALARREGRWRFTLYQSTTTKK